MPALRHSPVLSQDWTFQLSINFFPGVNKTIMDFLGPRTLKSNQVFFKHLIGILSHRAIFINKVLSN